MEVSNINTQEAIGIIKNAFCHLIYDEDIKIGEIKVLLHFPSIGIAVLEESCNCSGNESVACIEDLIVQKELGAKSIYLNMKEKNFNIGYVINDILIEAKFVPGDENDNEGRGTD